jgi:replicative DNA helicase
MFTENELDFASNSPDRLPPQNIEAEEVILGGILLDPEAITRICDRISPEIFYLEHHRKIYASMLELYREQKPTDLLSVTLWLTDKIDKVTGKNYLTLVGGRSKLAALVDCTVSAVNIDALAGLVMEKYLRRELIRVSQQNIKLAYATEIKLSVVLDEAQKSVFNLSQTLVDDRPKLVHVSEYMQETYSEMEKKLSGEIQSIKTGFYDVDDKSGGFNEDEFIVVGGRPGSGKTGFALKAAANMSREQPKDIYYFSLEMNAEQLCRRLIAQESRIEGTVLKQPKMMREDDWVKVSLAMAQYEKEQSSLYICDKKKMDVLDVAASIRRFIATTGGNPGAIFIDHIHILAGTEEGANDEYAKITKASRFLKEISSKDGFGCPVFGLAQLNRGVDARTNRRPMMSDLRASGALEQDADFVFLLYRDEYYNEDTPDKGIAELNIAKGRDTGTGVIKLLFDSQFAEFKNLAKPQY